MCYFVLCKINWLCKARVQFCCVDPSWYPSLQIIIAPSADHVLWMLVATSPNCGYRTAIPGSSWMSAVCLSICMAMQLPPHLNYVLLSTFWSTTCKFTENRNTNWITWIIDHINFKFYGPCICSQPASGMSGLQIKNTKIKKATYKTEHIKAAYHQKDLYCSSSLRSSIYHHYIDCSVFLRSSTTTT